MTAGIKANSDGSAAIQVGGTDVITLTSGGAATFVTSPTTVQAGTAAAPSITFSGDTNTGIYSPGADQVAIATGGTAAIYANSSQNVGIGTTSPAGKLDVAGTVAISPGNAFSVIRRTTVNGSYGVRIQGNTADVISDTNPGASVHAAGGPITGDSFAGRIDLTAYGNLTDSTSNIIAFNRRTGVNTTAESARIDSSGNFIKKPGSGGRSNPAAGDTGFYNDSGYGDVIQMGNTYGSGKGYVLFFNSTTLIGSITANSASSVSYGTTSDYRLKDDVQPMTGALAKVAALKPCTYKWKSDGSDGEGFIAHELQEVCPSAVTGEKDAVNEDGSIKPQGIDTSFLVATLTAAIQEQQAMIDELKAKVAALEGAA